MLLTVILPVAPAMYWRRTFAGRADQAHEVRAFAATLIPDHPRLDDVLFSVGELVANALRHTKSGRGGSFIVDLLHTGGRTAVSVADEGGPAEPVADEAGERSECGRGLRTVSLLADSWGWHGNDTGRTVTAVFAADTPTRPQMTNPGLRIRTTSRASGPNWPSCGASSKSTPTRHGRWSPRSTAGRPWIHVKTGTR
jgi:serine/threonine-protein kinase RsbW